MVYSDRAVDGLELRLDEGTEMGSSVRSFEGYNDGKRDGSLVGFSLGLEDGTELRSSDRSADGIELGLMKDVSLFLPFAPLKDIIMASLIYH